MKSPVDASMLKTVSIISAVFALLVSTVCLHVKQAAHQPKL